MLGRTNRLFTRSHNALRLDNILLSARSVSTITAATTKKFKSTSTKTNQFHTMPQERDEIEDHLNRMNDELFAIQHDPIKVLQWGMNEFQGDISMMSSFGIQSSVLLHLATQVKPDIDVLFIDTGYLPKETYQYAEVLREALNLENLTITSNQEWSPARMEALHGEELYNVDHALYGKLRKVDPMKKALEKEMNNPLCLLSGLRASQTAQRANMTPVTFQQQRFKLLPMLKMTDEDVLSYMDRFDLPAHPLAAKGYVTVGDWHSSRPVEEGEDPRNTRFGGKFQECGLHVEEHEPVGEEQNKPSPVVKEAKILPESLDQTGVKSLGLTKAHPDTDTAVIMVKKLTEDGSFCRKCNDVAGKIEQDNLSDWIGSYEVANVLDHSSEGSRLAKHFSVATAPFFLIRDRETELKQGEWKVVRSYLQLRRMLEKAADQKIEREAESSASLPEEDVEYRERLSVVERLQLELREAQWKLQEKSQELGLTP